MLPLVPCPGPPAAKGFDQGYVGIQALGEELGRGSLAAQFSSLGIDHIEKGDKAGAVSNPGQPGCPFRRCDRPVLGLRLVPEVLEEGERPLNLAKGDQHLLAVGGKAFFVGGAAALEVRPIAAALEDRKVNTGSDGPNAGVGSK